ncbi:MAG: restriction endonuclease subunit S [Methylococcales bacterium]|nr:restriction endonuclease subunit S [Methylococcales bacterium]
MNLKWSKTELGETIDTLKGCAFKSKDYVFDGVPVVRVSDFTENSIAEDKLVYLSEALAEEYSAYKLQHNNIVIQTVGSWQYNPASVVGKVIKIPKKLASSLLNQNAVKLIPNQNIDEKFLYYRLKDDTFKAHVLGSAQGAANQASITLTTIKRFKFFLPPLEVQQKIAAILSAYDDLIENNLNRIKLLEEMAQITYEEWFVRLKFPGHEATPMDSEMGLPVGWSNTKLGNYIKFHKGKNWMKYLIIKF